MGDFYFEDRVAGEFQEHAAEADALRAAVETLGCYRRNAADDGEWLSDVEDVVVGRIVRGGPGEGDVHVPTHRAVASGDEENGYDYAMAPVPAPGDEPAGPAP